MAKKPFQIQASLNEEDAKAFRALKRELGLTFDTEVIRYMLKHVAKETKT